MNFSRPGKVAEFDSGFFCKLREEPRNCANSAFWIKAPDRMDERWHERQRARCFFRPLTCDMGPNRKGIYDRRGKPRSAQNRLERTHQKDDVTPSPFTQKRLGSRRSRVEQRPEGRFDGLCSPYKPQIVAATARPGPIELLRGQDHIGINADGWAVRRIDPVNGIDSSQLDVLRQLQADRVEGPFESPTVQENVRSGIKRESIKDATRGQAARFLA